MKLDQVFLDGLRRDFSVMVAGSRAASMNRDQPVGHEPV
jgi:hypothetical protein